MPDESIPDDGEANAQFRRELAALGWVELFDAVKYSRQQHADLRRIAADIARARQVANAKDTKRG